MTFWNAIARTGQRETKAFNLVPFTPPDGGRAARSGVDYVQIWLAEIFLARRSTLLADWLPAAQATVRMTEAGRTPREQATVLRPNEKASGDGVGLFDHPLSDLMPYSGGTLEVEAALLGLQRGTHLDAIVDLLGVVSKLPVPALDTALAVATQVGTAAQELVRGTDGVVHLDLHEAWSGDAGAVRPVRSGYLAALLAVDVDRHDPAGSHLAELRVVDNRLHRLRPDGRPEHLVGWDFLLLRTDVVSERPDFWLPELEEQFRLAVDALGRGLPDLAESYRTAAVAVAWTSPLFTWTDRDRVIRAIHERFDALAGRGHGATDGPEPRDLTALVAEWGPSVDDMVGRAPLTPEQAFSGQW